MNKGHNFPLNLHDGNLAEVRERVKDVDRRPYAH